MQHASGNFRTRHPFMGESFRVTADGIQRTPRNNHHGGSAQVVRIKDPCEAHFQVLTWNYLLLPCLAQVPAALSMKYSLAWLIPAAVLS